MLRLKEACYLNADKTKVVKEGPDAAFLLGAKGALVSEADAKRFNLPTEALDEKMPAALVSRSATVVVPPNPDDDSVYDDQSERGKEARRMAREMNPVPLNVVDPPTQAEQQEENKALLGEGTDKSKKSDK